MKAIEIFFWKSIMPNEFPIMYFAEKIASELFDHVIECINGRYLTYLLGPDWSVVEYVIERHNIQLPNLLHTFAA